MKKEEVLSLLEDLYTVYGNKMNMENLDKTLSVWSMGLEECDSEKVKKNFVNYIRHSPFPPTIADMAKNALKPQKPKRFVMDYSAGEDWDV